MSSPLPLFSPTSSTSRYSTLLRLATPTVIAMLSQSLVSEIDVLFFARLPCPESSNGQAALFPSLLLLWLFGGSLAAVGVGTQALTARRFAEGNPLAAGAVLANGMFFCLGAGVLATVLGLFCLPTLLEIQIPSPEVRSIALAYCQWRFLGIISLSMTMVIKGFFDAIGRPRVHLVSALVMNVLNVLCCWVLVYGKGGAPRMGVPGAGASALMSTWIGLGIMLLALTQVTDLYHPFRRAHLSRALMGDLLRLSLPAGAATALMMIGFSLIAGMVSHLDTPTQGIAHVAGLCGGVEAVNSAANTDVMSIIKLTLTASLAFGVATATLVGQSLGVKRPDEAERYGWVGVQIGLGIFALVGLCEGVLFPSTLLSWLSDSEEVRAAARVPLLFMGISTPFLAAAVILSEALFGAGAPRFVAIAQLILVFGGLVPLAYLLSMVFSFGLQGIWAAIALYAALVSLVMAIQFARGSWKTIAL